MSNSSATCTYIVDRIYIPRGMFINLFTSLSLSLFSPLFYPLSLPSFFSLHAAQYRCNCLSGQTSFWENVLWANVIRGKCRFGQRSLGKCLWSDVFCANDVAPSSISCQSAADKSTQKLCLSPAPNLKNMLCQACVAQHLPINSAVN
jgi:hypothetical protein